VILTLEFLVYSRDIIIAQAMTDSPQSLKPEWGEPAVAQVTSVDLHHQHEGLQRSHDM